MSQNVSSSPYSTRLEHYGLIRGSGEQASAFLQGQFGNDLAKVDAHHHQLNCYSNPKGRLLAIFRVFMQTEHYYLRMSKDIIEATLSRLKMFVLMSKVTLDDVSDSMCGLGVGGEGAARLIAKVLGEAPSEVDTLSTLDGVSVLRIPGIEERFEIYAERERIASIEASLAGQCQVINEGAWMLGEIMAGIPTIFTQTREAFIAQMTNLQLIDGLSFKKGCYPGQEIVARMHYLGKLKRRMYLADIHTVTPPPPGVDIFSGDSASLVGKIVDARTLQGQPTYALCVLNIASAETDNLHLETPNGPLLRLKPLPYAFAEAEKPAGITA